MTDPVLAIGSERARAMRIHIPWTGIPVAAVSFDHAISLPAGATTLACGGLTLSGVVDSSQSGDFALSTRATFIGGAGGWRKVVPSRPYHNDAPTGVGRAQVALDAAGEVGEALTVDPALDTPQGADYPRAQGLASELLEGLFPGAVWWVDAQGATHVGTRPTRDVTGLVELLDADPALRTAILVADDLTNVLPGCSFTDARLGTFTIHDVDVFASGGKVRVYATESGQRDGRVLSMLDSLVMRNIPRHGYERGPYRFRVINMAGDRVNLQPVNDAINLPNMLPVGISPGMAGLSAQLQVAGIVLVDFIEGDPSLPIITGFARKDDPAFLPISVTIDGTTVNVGPSAATTVNIGNSTASTFGPAFILRNGEKIIIAGGTVNPGTGVVSGTIVIDPSETAPGAPGAGHSKGIA